MIASTAEMRRGILLACLRLTAAPAWLLCLYAHAEVPVRSDIISDPKPAAFSVCHGYGCKELDTVSLPAEAWGRIRDIFTPPSPDAGRERERIRRAIALMETLVGPLTGTSADRGGTQFFGAGSGQMDCIDESSNTTTYLRMLAGDGLLRWHTVDDRATRGYFLLRWPHTTAVIRDTATKKLWVVDSWFLDNGEPPFILPLGIWKSGWKPVDGVPAPDKQ